MNVSVVMSVYDKVEPIHLVQAIRSILSQTYSNFEFIIVLDGLKSKDLTNLIYDFSQMDKRIRTIENKQNMGLAHSMNKAINSAKGKYIVRMDADDISLPTRIYKQLQFLNQNILAVGTFGYEIDENGNIIFLKRLPITFEDIKKFFPKRSPLIHPSITFHRSFFDKVGYYENFFLLCEDYELWLRAIKRNVAIVNIPEFLYMFRINKDFFRRRGGIKKSVFEFRIKWKYAREMNFSLSNYLWAFSPFIIRNLPEPIAKRLYQYRNVLK